MPDTAERLKAGLPDDIGELLDGCPGAGAADRTVPARLVPQRPVAGQPDRRRPAALAGRLGIRWASAIPSSIWRTPLPTQVSPTTWIAACSRPIAATSTSATSSRLRIFKAVSLLRESLWSMIQTVASDIEFDYRRYAFEQLRVYRAAGSNCRRSRGRSSDGGAGPRLVGQAGSSPQARTGDPLFTLIHRLSHNKPFNETDPGSSTEPERQSGTAEVFM